MIKRLWQGLLSLRRGSSASDWEFEERRELVRLRCHLEVSYTVGSKKYFGQVVDMSLGGMMLRCLQPPSLGSMTDVTYDISMPDVKEDTVRCRVQWRKPRSKDYVHFVGLSYSSSEDVLRQSWVKSQLRQLGFRPERIFQKRKYVRVMCFIPVRLVTAGGASVEGRLYNLGANGTLLEAVTRVDKGEVVRLTIGPHGELPEFEVKGRVAASEEINRLQFLGVEFESLNNSTNDKLGAYLRCLLEETGTE
jgi:c-di-GMP-binding flagellar brake protein YcgR